MVKIFTKIGAIKYDTEDFPAPLDRTFRDAWENVDGEVITVNMEKARGIHRDKIRLAREPKLIDLDLKFAKAMRKNADITALNAELQVLLDAPADPAIDAATTPEELKLVQPAGLILE